MTKEPTSQCTKCLKDLPYSAFRRNHSKANGIERRCKVCEYARKRVKYHQNPAPYIARTEEWQRNNPEKYKAKWKRNRQKHMREHLARKKTQYAVSKGILIKQPCENCGAEKVEAHHADYGKPLDVRWLCRRHHTDLHMKPLADN